MREGGRPRPERFEEPVAGDHRAERGVPGGQPLRAGDDVGLVVEGLRPEHRPDPAEGADHLVAHEQHVVLVADLPDPLEVPRRRREAAAGVLHRLEEDGGDGVGALGLDRHRDLVGGPPAERLLVVGVGLGRPVEVGVGHLVGTGDERLEVLLERRDPGDGQGSLGRAVVGDGARDHLVLAGLADELEVLLRELPRGLDGLAAAAGEEDPVEVAGREPGDPLGELDGAGVGVRPQREERELLRLTGHRLADLGAAVPDLDDEEPGEPVDVLLARLVPDVVALAPDDERHLGAALERPMAGEVHPQVIAEGLGVGGAEGGGAGGGGHGWLLRSVVRWSVRAGRSWVIACPSRSAACRGGDRRRSRSCVRRG